MSAIPDPVAAAELRRLRRAARLSLRQLGARVNYSHTHLWEMETGRKPMALDVAKRLDDALDSGGALTALVDTPPADPDAADRLDHAAARPDRVDQGTVNALGEVLAQMRRLEDSVGVTPVIGPVCAHLATITTMVDAAPCRIRPLMVHQAAQWAQLAGWLHIAAGDAAGVRRWHTQALEWATEAGDGDLIALVMSFRAWGAELAGQHAAAVGLTRAALAQSGVYVGERAYDQYQLARALARTGDLPGARSAMDAGRDLVGEAVAGPDDPPPWHYYRSDVFYRLEEGTTYLALGEADRRYAIRAVDLLSAGLAELGDQVEWAGMYRQRLESAHALLSADRPLTACLSQ